MPTIPNPYSPYYHPCKHNVTACPNPSTCETCLNGSGYFILCCGGGLPSSIPFEFQCSHTHRLENLTYQAGGGTHFNFPRPVCHSLKCNHEICEDCYFLEIELMQEQWEGGIFVGMAPVKWFPRWGEYVDKGRRGVSLLERVGRYDEGKICGLNDGMCEHGWRRYRGEGEYTDLRKKLPPPRKRPSSSPKDGYKVEVVGKGKKRGRPGSWSSWSRSEGSSDEEWKGEKKVEDEGEDLEHKPIVATGSGRLVKKPKRYCN